MVDRETNAQRSILDHKKPGDFGRDSRCNTNTNRHYERFVIQSQLIVSVVTQLVRQVLV